MRNAKRLLELLNQEFPTVGGAHNNITFQANKSAENPDAPVAPRLLVAIWVPDLGKGGWRAESFYLDEVDLDKTPEQIVTDIKTILKGLAETADV
jgi:hypothetical protein